MTITLFTKPRCMQCDATKRALDKHGLNYQTIDLTEDAAALEMVMNLGHQQAPVVMAGEESWSGFRPDRIKAIAQQMAQLAPAAAPQAI